MIERGGELRLRHVGKGNTTAAQVRPLLHELVDRNVDRVMTDESTIYPFAFDGYCASKHETIAHKYEYVRGDVHTNTIESAFSLFKRGVVGSFHRVSHKHLQRYLSEFEYRFNRRKAGNCLGRLLQIWWAQSRWSIGNWFRNAQMPQTAICGIRKTMERAK